MNPFSTDHEILVEISVGNKNMRIFRMSSELSPVGFWTSKTCQNPDKSVILPVRLFVKKPYGSALRMDVPFKGGALHRTIEMIFVRVTLLDLHKRVFEVFT